MSDPTKVTPIEDLIDQEIERALQVTGGDAKKAAKLLGITKATVLRRLGKRSLGRLAGADHGMKGFSGETRPSPADGQEKVKSDE